MLGDMRQNFVGGIDNLTKDIEILKLIILDLKQHTDQSIQGMRDSCIGYIEEVIQLIDEQIQRLQRGGRRKTRTRKIKKQTRRSRSRSGSRSRRN
jgi:hypothetical protein